MPSYSLPPSFSSSTDDELLAACRSFDSGLSECGLRCPGGVLALDNRLDPYYKRLHENKVRPINTNFPCSRTLMR